MELLLNIDTQVISRGLTRKSVNKKKIDPFIQTSYFSTEDKPIRWVIVF